MAFVESKIINNQIYSYHRIVFHTFLVSDSEDPDLYAADPLWKWQNSDEGKFVMEHANDKPEWHRQVDYQHYGYRYSITAVLEEKKLTEYYLKFGKPGHKVIV